MKKIIFKKIKSVIDGSDTGLFAKFLKPLLFVSSLVFGNISNFRNFLYDKNLLKIKKAKTFIISIGNIVAGGGGKTPFVIFLINEILKKDPQKKIGLLSRGYGSKNEKSNLIIESSKKPQKLKALDIGDEPYLIKRKFKDVVLGIGRQRCRNSKTLDSKQLNCLILDDGMQHRKLFRDFEIVVLNSNDLFGKNHFLPYGFLRDHPKSLKRADLVVINNVEEKKDFENCKSRISKYFEGPVIATRQIVKSFKDFDEKDVSMKNGEKVAAFCGIAYPKNFHNLLRKSQHLEIVESLILNDHENPQISKLENFWQRAQVKGAKHLVCTEKDIVKLGSNAVKNLPVICLEMEVEVVYVCETWKNQLERLINLI
jgi:tetraacyldisaccharide 4'-kinase